MSLMSNFFGMNNQPNILSHLMNIAGWFQKLQQFATNPLAGLMSMNPNVNIPSNIGNNPQAMVQHLISSGQMTQDQFNQFSQSATQLQNMLPKF